MQSSAVPATYNIRKLFFFLQEDKNLLTKKVEKAQEIQRKHGFGSCNKPQKQHL